MTIFDLTGWLAVLAWAGLFLIGAMALVAVLVICDTLRDMRDDLRDARDARRRVL